MRVPFLIFSRNYDESVVQTSAIVTALTRRFSSSTSICVVSIEMEGWGGWSVCLCAQVRLCERVTGGGSVNYARYQRECRLLS